MALGWCSRALAHNALRLGKVRLQTKGRLFRQAAFGVWGAKIQGWSSSVYQMETMTHEARKPTASPTRTSER